MRLPLLLLGMRNGRCGRVRLSLLHLSLFGRTDQTLAAPQLAGLQGWDGQKGDFGNVPTASLYGEKGWCQADEPEFRCPCLHVGC